LSNDQVATTSATGDFVLNDVPAGNYYLVVSENGVSTSVEVSVIGNQVTDLGGLVLESTNQTSVIASSPEGGMDLTLPIIIVVVVAVGLIALFMWKRRK
jgi:hypothetical protein